MRFSLCVDAGRPWAEVLALVRHVEALGWDGVYVCDHFMPYDPNGVAVNGAMLEGWTTLAALAGHTERLRLGTLVLRSTHRHPAVVANMAATMDDRLVDAPCDPKPVQSPLPMLIGGGGERRTLRIAAQFADEWHVWATAAEFTRKSSILDRHCDDIGRDPATIGRATGALVALSTGPGPACRGDLVGPAGVAGPR